MRTSTRRMLAGALAALAAGCAVDKITEPEAPTPGPSLSPAAEDPPAPAPLVQREPSVHEGNVVARSPADDALYVADEDHAALLRIALPVEAQAAPTTIALPGPPAQVVALDGRVLVTIRSTRDDAKAPGKPPGLLLIFKPDADKWLVESARVALPADAWGVSVTPDETTALVTSAWTHRVSVIDLASATVRASLDVPREPRAVVIRPDGKSAYVTHLIGTALTRIDGLGDREPTVKTVPFAPAPLRTPVNAKAKASELDASLAYSAVLSPDGERLFVPRHALGALGKRSWFGQPTVDVLLTRSEESLAPSRDHIGMFYIRSSMSSVKVDDAAMSSDGAVPVAAEPVFVQPRAVVYRRSARTLLVAGEGDNRLVELDALALDPSMKALRTHALGGKFSADKRGELGCGAPSGLALSKDEKQAFVFCRTSGDLAVIELDPPSADKPTADVPPTLVHLVDDGLSREASLGRRLFFDATDGIVSGGLACNGCHPEGRDDGHVYQEVHHAAGFSLAGAPIRSLKETFTGYARQTPMLAGRVSARGPYGWHGRSATLEERLMAGFKMHRWEGESEDPIPDEAKPKDEKPDFERDARRKADRARIARIAKVGPLRALSLGAFVRTGLVPPPRDTRALDAEQEQGKAIFASTRAGCASCHVPATGYTDRTAVPLGDFPLKVGVMAEPDRFFKTPSLVDIAGTAPYYHDGHASSLEELVDKNHDRMGRTDHLSPPERHALIAFLRTL